MTTDNKNQKIEINFGLLGGLVLAIAFIAVLCISGTVMLAFLGILIPFAGCVYLWEAIDKKFLAPRRRAKAIMKVHNNRDFPYPWPKAPTTKP